MADHFTYLPSIGISIMLAWGITLLFPRKYICKKGLFPAAIAILFVVAALTWQQCGYWKNSIALFNHTLQITKDNTLAYHHLGFVYDELGQYQLAINNYNEAIRIKPNYAKYYNNRGAAYLLQGNNMLGCSDAQKACELGNCKLIEIAKRKGYCH
jgi:tetratricopeptide (TPR) repeat protein